jgi:uncharacterized protein YciI
LIAAGPVADLDLAVLVVAQGTRHGPRMVLVRAGPCIPRERSLVALPALADGHRLALRGRVLERVQVLARLAPVWVQAVSPRLRGRPLVRRGPLLSNVVDGNSIRRPKKVR